MIAMWMLRAEQSTSQFGQSCKVWVQKTHLLSQWTYTRADRVVLVQRIMNSRVLEQFFWQKQKNHPAIDLIRFTNYSHVEENLLFSHSRWRAFVLLLNLYFHWAIIRPARVGNNHLLMGGKKKEKCETFQSDLIFYRSSNLLLLRWADSHSRENLRTAPKQFFLPTFLFPLLRSIRPLIIRQACICWRCEKLEKMLDNLWGVFHCRSRWSHKHFRFPRQQGSVCFAQWTREKKNIAKPSHDSNDEVYEM